MTALALEVDRVMRTLDPVTSDLLDRTVRDALALAERSSPVEQPVDAMGYPIGYFQDLVGSFANEPLEEPADPPPQSREDW